MKKFSSEQAVGFLSGSKEMLEKIATIFLMELGEVFLWGYITGGKLKKEVALFGLVLRKVTGLPKERLMRDRLRCP